MVGKTLSRWALIFVVEARQRVLVPGRERSGKEAPGRAECRREESFRLLTFVDIPAFICAYLLITLMNKCRKKTLIACSSVTSSRQLLYRLFSRNHNLLDGKSYLFIEPTATVKPDCA